MTSQPLSPDTANGTIHATTVCRDRRGVMILGTSGAGKSDLALRLIDRGFTLVSDDQTYVELLGDRLVASAPLTIAGKLEVRGIGIVELAFERDVPVALVVELNTEVERLPERHAMRTIFGAQVPLIMLDARAASAPAKVALALDRVGIAE